ncbi:MAG: HDIG domain-containing protein [Tissierellaceae bacterium]|nr:HDIG domain-containing protein [Tissierellaceae bacterium]
MEKIKRKDKQRRIIYKLNNKKLVNIILLIAFTAILFFISLMRFEGTKLNVNIGDFAQTDIRATKDVIDEIGTENLKQEVANNVQPKYRIFPSIQIDMKDTISNLFDVIRDFKSQTNISNFRKAELIRESLQFEMSNDDLVSMLRMDYKDLSSYETTLIDLTNQIMGVGIREEELDYEKENLSLTFDTLNLTDAQKDIGINLLTEIIKANEFVDELETRRIKERAIGNVEDILIQENEIIALEGELINEQKYELIRESGLLKDPNESDIIEKIGILVLVILSVLTLIGYIYFFNNDIINNNRLIVLIIAMVLTILLSKGLYAISPYLIPVAAGGLLISLLISSKLGIFTNIFLTLFLGFILELDLSFITMLIIGGTIGMLAITYQKQRTNILVSGIIMALVNILIITSFGLIKGLNWSVILVRDLQVFLNGIITIIITIGSLPLWENLFSILTPIRLLELSNPNQPLLKRLLVEAPGTYHHSLMVGNLSEAAADKIGANSILVRVGAYYHDIGKLYKPYYFAENQFSMSNPHDLLEPKESARIILSHVTEGIKLAKENKLPKEIIDFIDEHHGTTTVAYFYYKAKEKDSSIDIEDFRYKGKKPQSKETALVMLADSVEAAVRSIKEPTKESISEMVNKVVKGKVNDNQLDECDITNKDINTAINTFISILIGIYHDRIEYPSVETIGEEG